MNSFNLSCDSYNKLISSSTSPACADLECSMSLKVVRRLPGMLHRGNSLFKENVLHNHEKLFEPVNYFICLLHCDSNTFGKEYILRALNHASPTLSM